MKIYQNDRSSEETQHKILSSTTYSKEQNIQAQKNPKFENFGLVATSWEVKSIITAIMQAVI